MLKKFPCKRPASELSTSLRRISRNSCITTTSRILGPPLKGMEVGLFKVLDLSGGVLLDLPLDVLYLDIHYMDGYRVFTFDAKGNILGKKSVEGYPKKKVVKAANVGTQAGMKELVEEFLKSNFRDVTSRETIEWGEVTKTKEGNFSIRYKYRYSSWYGEPKIATQIFKSTSRMAL